MLIQHKISNSQIAKPNFLVIGAQKCATSWLANNLKQHPDVFSPKDRDEVHFFDKKSNYSKGISWYQAQFKGYSGQTAVGEFTPNYFWSSGVSQETAEARHHNNIPKRIKQHYPNIKLIVSLRNPVKRAISAYYHHIRMRRISPKTSILEAGKAYGIISMGFYTDHFEEWFKWFEPSDFKILVLEEDVQKNPQQTLQDIYKFINVDNSFVPKAPAQKVGTMKSQFYTRMRYYAPSLAAPLYKLTPQWIANLSIWNIDISESEIEALSQIYAEQSKRLPQLINRELPW